MTDAKRSVATVLFDLDGTLADTAPDLAVALNALRAEHGRAPLPFDVIRPVVSHGATALVGLGCGATPEAPDFGALRARLIELYQAHLADHTRLFPGMDDVLQRIERRGINWGIVTNKPSFLTDPLVKALGLYERASCVVSGDTTAERKPHPAPLLHACHLSGSTAEHCLYVGDAERDIKAGHSAGMLTLVALYGYLGDGDAPDTWGAHGFVDSPTAILDWLGDFDQ